MWAFKDQDVSDIWERRIHWIKKITIQLVFNVIKSMIAKCWPFWSGIRCVFQCSSKSCLIGDVAAAAAHSYSSKTERVKEMLWGLRCNTVLILWHCKKKRKKRNKNNNNKIETIFMILNHEKKIPGLFPHVLCTVCIHFMPNPVMIWGKAVFCVSAVFDKVKNQILISTLDRLDVSSWRSGCSRPSAWGEFTG